MSKKEFAEYQKSLPDWISVGVVSGAHGIKGELKVLPTTDEPGRFRLLKSISLEYPANTLKEYPVQAVRFQKSAVLLKLDGIDNRTNAEQLKGLELKIPRDSCLKLPEDHYYYFQLIGLLVYSVDGEYLGKLTDVMEMPANDVYIIKDAANEFLIPAIKDVIKAVDLENGIMTIEVLEGLIG